MTKSAERDLIVGLDIGTSQIKAVVGEITADNQLSIVGVGTHASRGMDKGGVNDLNLVVQAVQRAVNEAELMADCQVSSVYLGITGKHIRCQNESGMVPINDTEVTAEDVASVIHAAKSVPISAERRMLHVLPQEFSVDMQEGIKSPVGMSGVRMEARAHIITCANDMAKNIEKCVERCGLHVDQLIFSALASSYAVLTDDEKELGVCVVDMGGGTIDIAIYTNGALRHTAVIPVAGNQVTSDIAKIFRTPISHAEEIKVQYACALRSMVGKEESIEVPSVGGRPARSLQRQTLAEVIEPRYTELLSMVNDELVRVQSELKAQGVKHQLAAGVVLTGGAAQIEGIVECAEQIFQSQVRVGEPMNIRGLSDYVQAPVYSTAVGLLQYGRTNQSTGSSKEYAAKASVGGLVKRVSNWLRGEF